MFCSHEYIVFNYLHIATLLANYLINTVLTFITQHSIRHVNIFLKYLNTLPCYRLKMVLCKRL